MAVNVRFIGSFRSVSGRHGLALKFERPRPLREVMKKIVEELPRLRQALIDAEVEGPRTSMLILVNGKEVSVLNGVDTMIKDEDEVVFVPVLHGG